MEHEGEGRCFIPSKLVNLGIFLVQSNAVNIIYLSPIARAVFSLSLDKRSIQRTFFDQLTTVQTLGSVMLLYEKDYSFALCCSSIFFFSHFLSMDIIHCWNIYYGKHSEVHKFFLGYYWKPSINVYHVNITLFSSIVP